MSKQFYIKQISLVQEQFQCQKTVPFQIIPFRINTQFKCNYSFIVKNISILKLFSLVKQFSFARVCR